MFNIEQTTDSVLCEVIGSIGRITINRPRKLNAIDGNVVTELGKSLQALQSNPQVRAIILTGAGRAFAAGADIAMYRDATPEQFRDFTKRCNGLCDQIEQLPKPVIAAVRGVALGGGFELVLSADIVIAATDAKFGLPEINLGLLPGWGGTQRLTQQVGRRKATEMIMTASRLSANEAQTLGLINGVVPASDIDDASLQMAAVLAAQPMKALAAIKNAIRAADPAGMRSNSPGFTVEQNELQRLFLSADGKEGIAAFVDKRQPQFEGL